MRGLFLESRVDQNLRYPSETLEWILAFWSEGNIFGRAEFCKTEEN